LGKSYPIEFDPPKSVDIICMEEDIGKFKKTINNKNLKIVRIYFSMDNINTNVQFRIFPKKYGPNIEEQLRQIVENCPPKP